MRDYCSVMHRLDRPHVKHYAIMESKTPGMTEVTLKQYLGTEHGKFWAQTENSTLVQNFIQDLTLKRLALPRNQEYIQREWIAPVEEAMQPFLAKIRHALRAINAFQVRVFAAFLFGMCTYRQMLNACEGQRVEDEFLTEDKDKAFSLCFEVTLVWYSCVDTDHGGASETRRSSEWCWPRLAPPSAMQWLLRITHMTQRFGDAAQCEWQQHSKAGLASSEEGICEVHSWWAFWEGQERYRPLEERASDKKYKEAVKATQDASQDASATEDEEKEVATPQERQKQLKSARLGKPVVQRNRKHAKSSKHRANIRLMFNSGTNRRVRKRYANLSIENINRNTNRYVESNIFTSTFSRQHFHTNNFRFGWRLGGWCGTGTAFIRCAITFLSANMTALVERTTLARLALTQPDVLRDMQDTIADCNNLREFQRWAFSETRGDDGLVMSLVMRKCKWKEVVGEKIRQHLLQFASDKLPDKYIKRWRVWSWICENHPDNGRTTLELLQRCREEVFPDLRPTPRAVYKIFNDLGVFFDGTDRMEEVEDVFLLADEER